MQEERLARDSDRGQELAMMVQSIVLITEFIFKNLRSKYYAEKHSWT